jgi:hypothetical protein
MNFKIHNLGHKYIYFVLATLFIVTVSFLTQGCADEPTSLGLQFVPPDETTGVKTFDSYIDSMTINISSVRRYVNTYNSSDLLVGQSGSYNSKGLIKFTSIGSNYDSAVVNSAVLKIKYRNYYYPNASSDSLGQVSFDIFNVLQRINYSTVTYDSISSTSFGTISQGSYTGVPAADSQEVNIDMNSTLVKDWFEYAADTNYQVKNNGLVLLPNAASNVIKGFYSGREPSSNLKPTLHVILTKSGITDTLVFEESETVYLATGDLPVIPGTFFIQGGINFLEIFKFFTNKIPSTAVINDAQFSIYLDPANSNISPQTIRRISGSYISDSSSLSFEDERSALEVNGEYTIRIIYAFQKWTQGGSNFGLLVFPTNRILNIDRFAFFDMNASDPNKRPRLIIRYTPRIIP